MAAKISVLIADDEPLARERLRLLLEKQPEVELVAECSDGAQALAELRKRTPDLAFLDVEMPELDGFAVVRALDPAHLPEIIFTTAHDKFAVKAFDIQAVDFLHKPYETERFHESLRRASTRIEEKQRRDWNERLSAFLAEAQPAPRGVDRLAVKSTGKVVLLNVPDIDWVEASDNYVVLHTGPETHLHRETMNSMEARLPADKFMRISRSAIVNVDRIKELQPMFHGEYAVILRNGTRVTLSRSYREKLDALVGKAA